VLAAILGPFTWETPMSSLTITWKASPVSVAWVPSLDYGFRTNGGTRFRAPETAVSLAGVADLKFARLVRGGLTRADDGTLKCETRGEPIGVLIIVCQHGTRLNPKRISLVRIAESFLPMAANARGLRAAM
jgi:hypothetical protein